MDDSPKQSQAEDILMRGIHISSAITLFCLSLTGFAADPPGAKSGFDPRFPSELNLETKRNDRPSVSIFRIPEQLDWLSQEIAQEEGALGKLPEFKPSPLIDALGYHSDYIDIRHSIPKKPLWTLDFTLPYPYYDTLDLVLVPASERKVTEPSKYGFPKRFEVTSGGEKSITYVSWRNEDFPDPGLRPVYFRIPNFKGSRLKLKVYSGVEEGSVEFFALSRVHMIIRGEVHRMKSVKASSGFESLPYWSANYLLSPQYTLGLPLGAEKIESKDFIMPLKQTRWPTPVTLEFDLGSNKKRLCVRFA